MEPMAVVLLILHDDSTVVDAILEGSLYDDTATDVSGTVVAADGSGAAALLQQPFLSSVRRLFSSESGVLES